MYTDHQIWSDTPYISFTNSPKSLQELADWRVTRNRGDQKIVVVDPQARFQLGLPILSCSDEMAHYDIQSRYQRNYWHNHYLCLWEVTPQEVVDIWDWTDLRKESNWYEDIIKPALQVHRERRNAPPVMHSLRSEESNSSSSPDISEDETRSDDLVIQNSSTGDIEAMLRDLSLGQK